MKLYAIEEYYDYDHPSWEPWVADEGFFWTDKANAEKFVAEEIVRRAQRKFKEHTDLWDRHKASLAEHEKAKKILAENNINVTVLSSRLIFSNVKEKPVYENILAKMQADPRLRVYEFETLD